MLSEVKITYTNGRSITVLILVLMEYALWGFRILRIQDKFWSLNPCFNGICSLSLNKLGQFDAISEGLNPCFNGICSLRSYSRREQIVLRLVLILVLMEYALWVIKKLLSDTEYEVVLILVLMEYALCLNPCFNGICSLSTLNMV